VPTASHIPPTLYHTHTPPSIIPHTPYITYIIAHNIPYYTLTYRTTSYYTVSTGHYRPAERHLKCLLEFFSTHGVDLGRVEVDVQRVLKMARQTHKGKK
jgi:hypothetical protein